MSWDKNCPDCKIEMLLLLDHSKYHPTGATGGGTWIFRSFALYECPRCGEYFYVEGKLIYAKPLKISGA